MTPRTQAIAYRIWAYCTPREWDCTIPEVAEAIDAPTRVVKSICQHRGWHHRLRGVGISPIDIPFLLYAEVTEQGPIYA